MSENLLHRVTFTDGTEETIDGAVIPADFGPMCDNDLARIEKIERIGGPEPVALFVQRARKNVDWANTAAGPRTAFVNGVIAALDQLTRAIEELDRRGDRV